MGSLFHLVYLNLLVFAAQAGQSELGDLLIAVGYIGIAAIIFAESGLLIGFFLPGDSLLFTAGFLASQDIFNITLLAPICFVAAVSGDSVGYWFGAKTGPMIFKKEDSLFFHKDHILRAQHFYDKHGGKTIIIARFLPIVRTFAPIVAGVGKMHYRTFLLFNVVGGFVWTFGLTLAGYFLGTLIPGIDQYLLPIIILIIFLSIAPTAWHILKEQENRAQIAATLRKMMKRS